MRLARPIRPRESTRQVRAQQFPHRSSTHDWQGGPNGRADEDDWNQRREDWLDKITSAISSGGIEEANRGLLRRYRDFRRAADTVTTAWRAYPEVAAVSLTGSVAREPWKEVPRFALYRRTRIQLWHECQDVGEVRRAFFGRRDDGWPAGRGDPYSSSPSMGSP